MFEKIGRMTVMILMVGALAGANNAESAPTKKASAKKTSMRQQKAKGWVSTKKQSKQKQRKTAASRKRTVLVKNSEGRSPAAVQASKRREIQKKYADLKRRLKEQHLQREEALMRQLVSEDRVGVRMENLRALQMGFQTEQEDLDLQESKEMCRNLNAECHRVPGYQLANTADFVPSFAQDTGFRND